MFLATGREKNILLAVLVRKIKRRSGTLVLSKQGVKFPKMTSDKDVREESRTKTNSLGHMK